MTGKTKDKRGNTCQFEHPPIFQKFRMFEKNPEKGCLEKECDKLHYNFCKWYHDCKNKENCFQTREEDRPFQPKKRTYEHDNWESHENINFLGQHYPFQVSSWV